MRWANGETDPRGPGADALRSGVWCTASCLALHGSPVVNGCTPWKYARGTGSDGSTITYHENAHFTLLPDGTMSVTFDKISVTCG